MYSLNEDYKEIIVKLKNHFYKNYKDKILEEPLLTGNEIMTILNIKPSKEVGEIKEKLIYNQICGNIKTKEEAINFIKALKINQY